MAAIVIVIIILILMIIYETTCEYVIYEYDIYLIYERTFAGFPIQGFRVQNHWLTPRSTQPFILPRSINEYQEFLASSKWL